MTQYLSNQTDRAVINLLIDGTKVTVNPGETVEWDQSKSESILWADMETPCSLSFKWHSASGGDGEISVLPERKTAGYMKISGDVEFNPAGGPYFTGEAEIIEKRELTENTLFAEQTIHASNPDVDYVPFIKDGRVGYRVTYAGRPLEPVFIYFNPSRDTDDGEPNVFVYLGTQNDPAQDEAQHWYGVNMVLQYLEDEPAEAIDPSLDDHGVPDSEGFGYE